MPNVIYETDMTFDVDDVGALALLHALVDRQEAKVLGVSYNEVHPHGTDAIQAINAWYGRGELPIGEYASPLKEPDDSKYLGFVARLRAVDTPSPVTDSVSLYQKLLEAQPDRSVTIISVGYLNNLAALLRTHPKLIRDKVKELIVMAGLVDDRFNFVRHGLIAESQFVLDEWPTPLIVTDYGGDLYTGTSLRETPTTNPVREAYFRWFDREIEGRSSWDQIAVLVGVRGTSAGFEIVSKGKGRLLNGYEWQLDGTHRSYARPTLSSEYYKEVIEELMSAAPNFVGSR